LDNVQESQDRYDEAGPSNGLTDNSDLQQPKITVETPNGSRNNGDGLAFTQARPGFKSCSTSDTSEIEPWVAASDENSIKRVFKYPHHLSSEFEPEFMSDPDFDVTSDPDSIIAPSAKYAVAAVAAELHHIVDEQSGPLLGNDSTSQIGIGSDAGSIFNDKGSVLSQVLDKNNQSNFVSRALSQVAGSFSSSQHITPSSSPVPTPSSAHLAPPGDLLLSQKVADLKRDIERLTHQDLILDMLISKASKFNRETELRILRKSKIAIRKELNEKMFQKDQYEVQATENVIVPVSYSINSRSLNQMYKFN
jgi:hypothetical protein